MEITIQSILSDENLKTARESFIGKRDSCGIDGIKLSMLDEYWEINGEKIKKSIMEKKYKLGIIQQQDIVNQKGKKRTISLMNTVDRFIFRAVTQVLSMAWNPKFSEYAYAYREHKGVKEAVEQAVAYIEDGNSWCAEIDIQNFFDNIDHNNMLEKLQEKIEDPKIIELLVGYIKCTVMDDHIFYQKDRGILQGGPLSPLLSNIYMNEIDHYMEKNGYCFCRFGDNINIYCNSYELAFQQYQDVKEHLEKIEKVPLNKSKSGVYKSLNRKFLGYCFEEKSGKVIAKHEKKAYTTIYRDWYTTGIKKVDHNYHLINEGILTKRDYTLLFEGPTGKKYIPIETTDSLYVYSNIIFSGNFFECHIDGNSMGKRIQNIMRNITEYKDAIPTMRHLSLEIAEVFGNTFENMTAYMKQLSPKIKKNVKNNLYRKIIVAGDDITFVCNAKLALPAVKYFLSHVGEEKDYSACGGIAYFNSHFPFSDAYQVAEACCDSAKKKAKIKENRGNDGLMIGNFFDFQVCTNIRAAHLDTYRDKHYLSDQGYFIARPYYVKVAKDTDGLNEKNQKYSVEWLEYWSEIFRKMPRSKAKQLRNVIPMGKNEIQKTISFLTSRGYKIFEESQDEYQVWYDALEIMDLFIGGEIENEDNN